MKKMLCVLTVLVAGLISTVRADFRSLNYTTVTNAVLTIGVETNTRFILHSYAIATTQTVNGAATVIHNRLGYQVALTNFTYATNSSFVYQFTAPYIIDGKVGDTITVNTTNLLNVAATNNIPAAVILNIDRN